MNRIRHKSPSSGVSLILQKESENKAIRGEMGRYSNLNAWNHCDGGATRYQFTCWHESP